MFIFMWHYTMLYLYLFSKTTIGVFLVEINLQNECKVQTQKLEEAVEANKKSMQSLATKEKKQEEYDKCLIEKMKIEDIKDKNIEELESELEKLKKESFNLRFQKAGGQLENTARVRFVRRSIARILTVINSKVEKV